MKLMKNRIFLLPNYFKIIGVVLIAVGIAVFILQTQSSFLISDEEYDISVFLILSGLFPVNFAKEKVEDERFDKLRLISWSLSFYTIAVYVILGQLINFVLINELEFYKSSKALLFVVLLINIIHFNVNKETDGLEK